MCFPLATSHSFTGWSRLPEAKVLPSGANATLYLARATALKAAFYHAAALTDLAATVDRMRLTR